ncbi:BCD family MFS transporter [Parerythrobacter aurantius]|uniref:BCD family MFS transporter n=1 Tax=Parerythrobacter aurantius TaxID=3127706 RepID=UPI00324B123C
MQATGAGLGWIAIVRLGVVQAAIGAMVMLSTSLLNRLMVVEYAIPAAVPAALVAWHYAVQLTRPLWGHTSDRSQNRTSWIIAGLGILALGTLLAVDATVMMAQPGLLAALAAVAGFTLIGFGVGMSGTALLALLASRTTAARKAPAAAICWSMMVAGIVVAAAISGSNLDPYSEERLAIVASLVALGAFGAGIAALRHVERDTPPVDQSDAPQSRLPFAAALARIWQEREARRFTYFVFLSMLAYSMQDLILEPFAGIVFGMTPGESTRLAGVQHSGVLAGMMVAGIGGSLYSRRFGADLSIWIVAGCIGSALMLGGLAMAASQGPAWPLKANVFGLGLANGVFAVAAVGSMLGLARKADGAGEGARMGVWGAAQAVAFGLGGLSGAVLVDVLRAAMLSDGDAFRVVFCIEAALFVAAALVATGTTLVRAPAHGEVLAQ